MPNCQLCGQHYDSKTGHDCPAKRPAPSCKFCKKPCRYLPSFRGVGATRLNGGWTVHCGSPECEAKQQDVIDELLLEQQQNEYLKRVDKLMAEAELPPVLAEFTLDDFHDWEPTKEVFDELPRKPQSLFLWGPNGTGKSGLAVALLQFWKVRCLFVSAHRILARIKSTYRRRGGESEEGVLNDLRSYQALVIDDLGAEAQSDFNYATLYEVVKERDEHKRATIVTSNLNLTEIDKLEPRMASRLASFQIVKMAGKDARVPSAKSA